MTSGVHDETTRVMRIGQQLDTLAIEIPSWGFGNTGTRFKVFSWPGAARTVYEKIADAALIHRLTGRCPTVAIHIPWDRVDDWEGLRRYTVDLGLRIGSVNPNLFQDDDYRLGSLCHPVERVRRKAIGHVLECIEIAEQVGSSIISLWLADGTNYPGQDSLLERKRRLLASLTEICRHLPSGMTLLLEYKFFEPAFYHTDLADWGMAYLVSRELGPQVKVLVDLGHHPLGTNVEQIVAWLLDEDKLGGFHFNSRKYADDDLVTGSINPFELFLIFHEIVSAMEDPRTQGTAKKIAYMIDQSAVIESKLEAILQAVVAIETTFVKALLVDRAQLRAAQEHGDILEAYRLLQDAYETDVRPLLAQIRRERGLPADPIRALREGGYEAQRAQQRGAAAATGGYATAR